MLNNTHVRQCSIAKIAGDSSFTVYFHVSSKLSAVSLDCSLKHLIRVSSQSSIDSTVLTTGMPTSAAPVSASASRRALMKWQAEHRFCKLCIYKTPTTSMCLPISRQDLK
jgi:hypothetical protein